MLDLLPGEVVTMRLSPGDLLRGERSETSSCPWARCTTRTLKLESSDWVRAGNGGIVIHGGDGSSVVLKPLASERSRYSRMITTIDSWWWGKWRTGLAKVSFVRER